MAGKPRRFLTAADGRTMSLTDWARTLGLPVATLRGRLRKLSLDEAIALGPSLTHPEIARVRAVRLPLNGQARTVREWADEYGLKETTLRERLRKMPLSIAVRLSAQHEPMWVDHDGARRRLADVCRELGLNYSTIKHRVEYGGLAPRQALLRPARPKYRFVPCWGEVKTIQGWTRDPRVRRLRLSANLISCRLSRGKSPEEALGTPLGRQGPGRPD